MQRNSVNKVLLVGRTGSDADVRYTTKGMAIATISLATSETKKDGKGEFQETTEWHRVVVFGKTAEFTENYVKKGALIYVEGRIHTHKWEDKEEKQQHYMTEIVGDKLIMLGGWKKGSEKSATIAVAEAEEEVPF